jgi:glycosyltransferase involved in cell wall biosynthesis
MAPPMRVLFVTHYFPPEVGAAQTRLFDLAVALRARGHEITVLTGFPNYPDGVIPEPYRGRLLLRERLGGLHVVRAPILPAPNRGVVRRLLNHLSFAVSAPLASLGAGPADVVLVETPPLFGAISGLGVAALRRAPALLHVADLWPDAVIQFGVLRHRPVVAAARALERFAYRHADALAVPTPGLQRVLHERGGDDATVVLIPHGVDVGRFPLDGDGPASPRRVVYSGTIGLGHATGTLIEAGRILERREPVAYEIMIAGDGAEAPQLREEVRRSGPRNVSFLGRLPRAELPALLASAGVAVATQRDLPLLADALSTKVLEYMAAARPVVVAASGWTAEVVRRADAGIACPPEDADALAAAIVSVAADPERARIMGHNGRRYVEAHLSRTIAVDRLEQALMALATGGPTTTS